MHNRCHCERLSVTHTFSIWMCVCVFYFFSFPRQSCQGIRIWLWSQVWANLHSSFRRRVRDAGRDGKLRWMRNEKGFRTFSFLGLLLFHTFWILELRYAWNHRRELVWYSFRTILIQKGEDMENPLGKEWIHFWYSGVFRAVVIDAKRIFWQWETTQNIYKKGKAWTKPLFLNLAGKLCDAKIGDWNKKS